MLYRRLADKAKATYGRFRARRDFPELYRKQAVAADSDHLRAAMDWLCYAQDRSGCGGIPASYDILKRKWGKPYRETTGYIIPTFINYSKISKNASFEKRALQMAEWVLSEQLSDGAYGEELPDGTIKKKVFNTGQVMLGLCSIYDHTGDDRFLRAAARSADWLVSIQETDGQWKKFTTAGARTYHSRVDWPLLEVFKRTKNPLYEKSAVANLEWIMGQQTADAWFENCSLSDPGKPWTHLIAYTLRGLLECSRLQNSDRLFKAVYDASSRMLDFYERNDFRMFPGTFDRNWRSDDRYSCLTGNVQTAIIWLKIWSSTGEKRFKHGAYRLIDEVKRSQPLRAVRPEIIGGIPSSYPIWGDYGSYSLANWTPKFLADALMLKMDDSTILPA